MSEMSKADKAIEAFNDKVESLSEEIKGKMVIVRDGSIMGCSKAVYPFRSEQIGQVIDAAVKSAEEAFASRISALENGASGDIWKDLFIQAVAEDIEDQKYRGDPYDREDNVHDMVLGEIIKIVPGFVKGLET